MNERPTRREPESARRSLRSELLFNLAFLAAAALVLALWTASLLQFFVLPRPLSLALLVGLVALDLLIFLALGNSLVKRMIVEPLADTVADLGGRIEVSSAEGGGAIFHLLLPVSETAA